MFFDTHCHLDMMVLKNEREHLSEHHFEELDRVMSVVRNAGVDGIINIGASLFGCENSIALAHRYKEAFAVIGLHPCDCEENWLNDFERLKEMLKQKNEHKIVGIGETGLDFYHKPFDKERQISAFRAHIELALMHNLPVVVHSRDASDDVLTIVQEYIKDGLRGVLHCFSHPAHVAEQVLSWGFYIGIGAYVTYPKNDELRSVLRGIPLDRLLLETDAPFLPPQQYRGKQNSPVYIPLFAHMIADIKGISHQSLGELTTKNAYALFSLDDFKS